MSAHTPGPWEAVFLFTADVPENAKVCIHAAPKSDLHNGTKVAEAEFSLRKSKYHVDVRAEAEANARLIAAAPELLDALLGLLCALPSATSHPAIRAARAAIGKAKGGAA